MLTLRGYPRPPLNYELCSLYACQNCEPGHYRGAEGTLHAPDGDMVPGGYYCARHAGEIVAEYAEKLGEAWTFRPFDRREATP